MRLIADTNFDIKLINKIAKNYSPLDYSVILLDHLTKALPSENFDSLSKYELHKYINDLLLEHYLGEQVFKYKLCKNYFGKKDSIGAFEINVNGSRADFLTINGHTSCFEIKTGLDNFSKFKKQAADYESVFEYNYLLVDYSHHAKALEVIPESFGLWISKNGKHKQIKQAALNSKLNAQLQLNLLNKQELVKSYPGEKPDRKHLLKSYCEIEINQRFKQSLKDRYRPRWEFIVRNRRDILPIDLQFFFNRNILPHYIYH
ncbi:MAG: sce7726 family protein [Ferruginibacter sp.]